MLDKNFRVVPFLVRYLFKYLNIIIAISHN